MTENIRWRYLGKMGDFVGHRIGADENGDILVQRRHRYRIATTAQLSGGVSGKKVASVIAALANSFGDVLVHTDENGELLATAWVEEEDLEIRTKVLEAADSSQSSE